MLPPRGLPIVPSQHMSVGENHRRHTRSQGASSSLGHQLGTVIAGSSQSERNILPGPSTLRYRAQFLPTSTDNAGMLFDDGEQNRSNDSSGSFQDLLEDDYHLRPNIRPRKRSPLEETSQYSPMDMEDDEEDQVEGDEEVVPKETRQARKRRREPEYLSALQKRLDAVPGGAGANHGPRGQTRRNPKGQLEYLDEDKDIWIPAVYHKDIRSKLIRKSHTHESDVYTHRRVHGKEKYDVTSFLPSQKEWNLDRNSGWANIPNEVLYKFALDYGPPTYEVSWMIDEGRVVLDPDNHPILNFPNTPWTLSSKVEAPLMEAIRRIDRRIRLQEFWARTPPVKGKMLEVSAFGQRINLWRLENRVTAALNDRRDTETNNAILWDQMSPADRAANSTRGLPKLTKAELKEARKPKAGKPKPNAGGWALRKEDQDQTEEDVPASASAQEEGATTSISPGSSKGKRRRSPPELGYEGDAYRQPPSSTSQFGRHTQADKRQRVCQSTPSASSFSQNSYPGSPYDALPLDPLLHSNAANYAYGPSSSSPGSYDLLPTEVAPSISHESLQYFPFEYGQSPFAGFSGVMMPSFPAPQHYNDQPTVPIAQYHGTYQNPAMQNAFQSPQWNPYPRLGSRGDEAEDFFFRANGGNVHTTPTGIGAAGSYPSSDIDYRGIRPRSADDVRNIQNALNMTRANYVLWVESECPPTTRHESYFFQLQEILNNLAVHWASLGRFDPMPDIVTSRQPWRNGFGDWAFPTGGNAALQSNI